MKKLIINMLKIILPILLLAAAPGITTPATPKATPKTAPEKVSPVCGPYVQNPEPDGFTVLWETNMDAMAWVEVAPDDGSHFYNRDRKRYFDLRGLGNQYIGTMHKIRIDGLEPGTTYRYRIMMKGVLDFTGTGNPRYTKPWGNDVYKGHPYTFTTPAADRDTLRFDIYNDIHQRDADLDRLMKAAAKEKPDFVLFNGDMTSSLISRDLIRDTWLRTAAANLEGITPMYVLRGNHELRGRHASAWMDYNDLPEGLPYRTASWGKFFLIFLDTLEDKPDSDIEYGGTMLSEPYLKAQAEWLEKVVESDGCRNAAVRLVFAHIPPDRNGWQGDRNVEEYFVPILNKAGITAMFCGHLHQWRIDNPGQRSSANFPVVINPNCRRMEVTASPEGLSLKVFDLDGAQTQSWSCPAR